MKPLILALSVLFAVTVGAGHAAAENVRVRAGIHEQYNRVVFDWARPVGYRLSQEGQTVTLTFDRAATLNTQPYRRMAPPWITSLSGAASGDSLRITFTVPEGMTAQAFKLGQRIAVDVARARLPGSTQPSAAPRNIDGPMSPERAKESLGISSSAPATQVPQITPPSQKELVAKSPPNLNQRRDRQVNNVSKDKPVLSSNDKTATAAATKSAPQARPTPKPNNQAPILNEPKTPQREDTVTTVPAEQVAAIDTTPSLPDGSTTIRFKPSQQVGLAVYQRAGHLWLVFDSILPAVSPEVEGAWASYLTKVRRISLRNGTVYRFELPEDPAGTGIATPSVRVDKQNLYWTITLNESPGRLQPISFDIDEVTDPQKPALVILNQARKDPLTFTDSIVGDTVMVMPVATAQPGRYVPREMRGVDLTWLKTDLGAAWVLHDPAITAKVNRNQVRITSPQGLRIAEPAKKVVTPLLETQDYGDEPSMFDFTTWQDLGGEGSGPESFVANRQVLESRLTQLEGIAKATGYMNLARFYIGRRLGAEARGALRIASDILPDLSESPEYQALMGVSHAMAGDYQRAIQQLTIDQLAGSPDVLAWVGYSYARQLKWDEADDAFARADMILYKYPRDLALMLGFAAVQTDIANENYVMASQRLDELAPMGLKTGADKAAYAYLRANVLLGSGEEGLALSGFERVSDGRDKMYRALAEFQLVPRALARGDMDADEAITRLERQRFAWRGDRLEVLMMKRLGELYFGDGQYEKGLEILREAASIARESDDVDRITRMMTDKFRDLFIDRDADKLTPIQAVSLYETFRELTPVGAEARPVYQYLASRLLQIDLIDRAKSFLTRLMEFPLTAEERAELGVQLATIHLVGRAPDEAVQVLNQTAPNKDVTLPDDVVSSRLHLMAKAHADRGETDRAMDLLRWDLSEDGMRLKADISWQQGAWRDADRVLDRIIRQMMQDGIQDDERQDLQQLILRRGVALGLLNETRMLIRLRDEYSYFMNQTNQAAAFDVVTQTEGDLQIEDLQTVRSSMVNTQLFDDVLKGYRADLAGEAPAEANETPEGETTPE